MESNGVNWSLTESLGKLPIQIKVYSHSFFSIRPSRLFLCEGISLANQ